MSDTLSGTREREYHLASLFALVPLTLIVLSQFFPRDEWADRSPFGELARDPFVLVLLLPFFGVPFFFAACTAFGAVRGRAPGLLAFVFASIAIVILTMLALFVSVLLLNENRAWTRGPLYWLAQPWPLVAIALVIRAALRTGWERWATVIAALVACAIGAALGTLLIDSRNELPCVWTLRGYALAVGMLVPLALWILMPRWKPRARA